MVTRMRRAFIYCRISRDAAHDELGVTRQEDDCRALCASQGIEVAEVFVDDDRSAYTGKPRPAFLALKAEIENSRGAVVVAWHPDRLTRHPRELEDLIDLLERSKATVLTVQSGEYDLATAAGRMTARVVGAVARHESEHKSARIRRKHVELAESGKLAGGGRRPFGYEPDRVTIRESEAVVFRDLVARMLLGQSLASMVVELNRTGVVTSGGGAWTVRQLSQMLKSPHHAGVRYLRGAMSPAVWPGLISEDDYRRVRAILDDPSRRSARPARRYLLTGVLQCGVCGERMIARPRNDRRRSYRCVSGCVATLSDPVEALVVASVLARVDANMVAQAQTPVVEVDELSAVEARMAELGEMWAAGEIDRAGWVAARKQLQSRYETIVQAVQVDVRGRALARVLDGGDLAARWEGLTFEQQRVVVLGFVSSVVVGRSVPGRSRFDDARFDINWR